MELSEVISDFVAAYLADPETNNLGPGHPEKAWDGFIFGFSAGDDAMYPFLKEHIGEFHWTPAEAFALGRGGEQAEPGELTVVSWAVAQTESTKASNRTQTKFPSEAWARSRLYGHKHLRVLHRALVAELDSLGYAAVAPGMLAEWGERRSESYQNASNWSERHVAHISGLGTFGLCGGLITEVGKAMRLGSIVVRAAIPATPRPYSDPFAYCLHYQDGSCAECADRCPVGSVSAQGRDKRPCELHLDPATEEFVKREYGFDGYGCGLCQTGVPCESRIPQRR